MLTVHNRSDTGLFQHVSNPAFCNLQFEKQISFEAHPFFESILNFMSILEIRKKIEKMFLDLEI